MAGQSSQPAQFTGRCSADEAAGTATRRGAARRCISLKEAESGSNPTDYPCAGGIEAHPCKTLTGERPPRMAYARSAASKPPLGQQENRQDQRIRKQPEQPEPRGVVSLHQPSNKTKGKRDPRGGKYQSPDQDHLMALTCGVCTTSVARRLADLLRMASSRPPHNPLCVPAEQTKAVVRRTKCYNPPLQISAQGAGHP
jgi:hypothetical protein